jgi:2-methylisocitrate lyase-like PEP mutase family enzyme
MEPAVIGHGQIRLYGRGMDSETQRELSANFLALHRPGDPLLIPNPWDAGSARLLASIGFQALATTSSGSAAAMGRLDGELSADEVLAHAATIVAATELPVSADLENGFAQADDLGGVAQAAHGAVAAGLAGFSIEDYGDGVIYERRLAVQRVEIAAAVARESGLVLTARAENHIRGHDDLDDTITRLQAYQEAGADVLYAPGLTAAAQISAVIAAVDKPVNVLARAGSPPVSELAALGVSRVSVGGAFAFAAFDALVQAAREFKELGTYGFTAHAASGSAAVRAAFGES